MEEIQRLRVKRRGLKGSITKLLAKVDEALTAELERVSVESTPELRRILVATTVEQLRVKHEQIIKLDSTIAEMIQKEDELESEICDADTYQTNLEQQIAVLTEFTKKANQPPAVSRPTHPPKPDDSPPTLVSAQTTTLPSSTEAAGDSLPETEVNKKLLHSSSDPTHVSDVISHDIPTRSNKDTHMNYSRLPKLHLPTLMGTPYNGRPFGIRSLQQWTLTRALQESRNSTICALSYKGMHPTLSAASHYLIPIMFTHWNY